MNRRRLLTFLGLAPVAVATGVVAAQAPTSVRMPGILTPNDVRALSGLGAIDASVDAIEQVQIQFRDIHGNIFVNKTLGQDMQVLVECGMSYRVNRGGFWTEWRNAGSYTPDHYWVRTFRNADKAAPAEVSKNVVLV